MSFRLSFTFVLAALLIAVIMPFPPSPLDAQNVGSWGATGQQAVTGSAAALASSTARAACVKAASGNSLVVYVGNSASVTTSTGYGIEAGQSFCTPLTNLNQIYVIASSTGSSVTWFTTRQ